MVHQDDHLLDARHQIHRAAHPLHHLPRYCPVREVAIGGDLHSAENRHVDMSASDHGEAIGRGKKARRRKSRDRLFASVDQVRIGFALVRERSDAEHAVLRLERDLDVRGNMVCDQGRYADAKIDVVAVSKLSCGAGRHLVAGPALLRKGHQATSFVRVVSFSISFSLVVDLTIRFT